ncbi:hypothetical protein [Streptomyces diastatochromogenes]|uniref:Uncharacterized protein n=1 Tax=Streptomyces diastatochromogenes TaxID=42236 RepID=A0A233SPM9_STRDA|nr:hypothetical protein [Streptomyces diastatochromogenes]MCZ0987881.1 hypothetical protein [Streptomyces diastatochromogenes]OXY97585.1 hypothetical protein BEK98_08485 [Streptomyces diastatochromogenes]
MSSVSRRRGTATAVQALSTIVLTAGLTAAPQALTGGTPASAADCTTYSVPTYVFEPATSNNIASKRTLHKYMQWGPQSADADLLDTLYTATLPMTSKVFTGGGNGIIYEATIGGQVKAYKDNTATGGSLLTAVKTYSFNWSSAKRILTNGQWILVVASDGTMDVYKQSSPATGDGTITQVATDMKSSITTSIANADDAWMVNSAVQWLKDGTIQQTVVLPIGTSFKLWGSTDIATGVDAAQAWSPGGGAISTQSVTSDPDTTGQIRSFTTGPWTSVDDDIRSGVVGEIMADAGPCLTDPDPEIAPYFGTPPDETGGEAATDPADNTVPAPTRTVTGKFTLGNGNAAPGLPVTVMASDTDPDATGQVTEPILGTATTAADGSWSLTLPSTLPAAVQKAVDDNNGVLNVQATATGTTATSGVPVLGVDALSTVLNAPATPSAVTAAADGDHTVKLAPNTLSSTSQDTYAASTEPQTFAAQVAANPTATDQDTPLWQSDNSTLAASYNPYLVNGKDVSAETVNPPITPMDSGTCSDLKFKDSSSTKYTVVGEAHAGWDAKATFEYESSMSSSFDIAVKSSGNWSIGGTKELSGSTGVSVGYANKGPHYAHQYKVPVEYIKYKHQHICSGTVRSTWYTIEASRYKAPAGGAVGAVGKDVSSKDGSANFDRSPKANRNYVNPGNTLQLSHGKSVKFGNAVSAFGVSLGAKTGYDSNHKQKIVAGDRSGKHWIWGKNGSISSGHAGVFYSK